MDFTEYMISALPKMARSRERGRTWRELAKQYNISVETCKKYVEIYQIVQKISEPPENDFTRQAIERLEHVIPFLKNRFALQVFEKCNLICHKLTVCATKRDIFN